MLKNEQAKRGQKDREAAAEIDVLQQTFSAWKHGSLPRPNKYDAVAAYLKISHDMLDELVEEARHSTGSTKLPQLDKAREYGRVSDRKEGKFKFDSLPTSKYAARIDTNVMEPALLYGRKAWLDPAVWPAIGHEVIVHGRRGAAWLGRLAAMDDSKAVIENASGRIVIDDVQAIHAVVLSERVAGDT
ncbi:XRE family transcriptional regulator [Ensifer sp. MPMI2T]|nr:XRE family transcriptional regulator [Ensifer sp. MPMI2T]